MMFQRPEKLLLPLGITLFWIITMVALIQRNYTGDDTAIPNFNSAAISNSSAIEQWMGIYWKGSKIGHAHHVLKPETYGYSLSDSASMRLTLMGGEKDVSVETSAKLDAGFRALEFVADILTDVPMRIHGAVQDNAVLLTVDSGGVKRQQEIKLRERPYLNSPLIPLIGGGIRIGDKVSLPLFDPASMAEGKTVLTVAGREMITSLGVQREVYRLEGEALGARTVVWVTPEGDVIREETLGFTFLLETKEQALAPSVASTDLIADFSIPFNLELKPGTSYLKVRLKGIGFAGLDLTGGGQKLSGDVLEITAMTLPITSRPIPPEPGTMRIKDDLFVQDSDPAIRAKADALTAGALDQTERARRIYEWAYTNIKKTPTMSIPRASDVLRLMQGDCNEHTVLYTALARASGIPARMAMGLVYMEGRFYYHAWPEVYLGAWVAVDPTLGQFPADAAHIRLVLGGMDRQMQLAPVLGNLAIEGLESR